MGWISKKVFISAAIAASLSFASWATASDQDSLDLSAKLAEWVGSEYPRSERTITIYKETPIELTTIDLMLGDFEAWRSVTATAKLSPESKIRTVRAHGILVNQEVAYRSRPKVGPAFGLQLLTTLDWNQPEGWMEQARLYHYPASKVSIDRLAFFTTTVFPASDEVLIRTRWQPLGIYGLDPRAEKWREFSSSAPRRP